MYAGYIFSTVVQNERLAAESKNLAARLAPHLSNGTYKLLAEISQIEIPKDGAECKAVMASLRRQLSLSEKEAAVLLLTVATSYSPARNNDAVIETVLNYMEPAGIVETVVWLPVLQLFNRLSSYYTLTNAYQK